jgi:hypothetical protein
MGLEMVQSSWLELVWMKGCCLMEIESELSMKLSGYVAVIIEDVLRKVKKG